MKDPATIASAHPDPFEISPISREIWELKYRLQPTSTRGGDQTVRDTFARAARAAAKVERGDRSTKARWRQAFLNAIDDFGFLPAGRILAGAGTRRKVTLFNCFVMGQLKDDLSAIFTGVRDGALTMQQGGGIGQDFSTLRPRGAMVRGVGADASGPVSFMDVWDSMCQTIMSAGARRGAMMATLRCDHPDIEEFVAAKSDPSRLRNFNVSVLVTDAFVAAVEHDSDWPLVFAGKVYRTVKARALWDQIMRATYDYAEPGVIFIDRVNAENNLGYCEDIYSTNPCGEQPLPPNGACLLGSINLARFVNKPFSPDAGIDSTQLDARVQVAVRFLDNIIDASKMPLPAQKREAQQKRRIGLGVTGLADALILCGLKYNSEAARQMAAKWMAAIQEAAYRASIELAAEKGAFALFDANEMLERPGLKRLPDDLRRDIRKHGLRNGCLTSIAPTGTISLLAGNVSSGIEPVFDLSYRRSVRASDGTVEDEHVEDYAYAIFKAQRGKAAKLPDTFVTAGDISPADHIGMQAALQPHVDSSISKTINCPASIDFDTFKDVYMQAYKSGLKGCTTFRPNAVTGAVLAREDQASTTGGNDADADAPAPERVENDVVYMSPPLEREPALAGYTYKLKWTGSDHAIYVTINDTELGGRRRPFEIFINTKNLEHYAWTVALTRMISAVFRRGGDVSFVVEELKAVFDPQGGQWMNGRYVPSLLAAIGEIIEQHMIRIGFLQAPVALAGEELQLLAEDAAETSQRGSSMSHLPHAASDGRACSRCGQRRLYRKEGCWICRACGHSKC